jgi:hypothetical protein
VGPAWGGVEVKSSREETSQEAAERGQHIVELGRSRQM